MKNFSTPKNSSLASSTTAEKIFLDTLIDFKIFWNRLLGVYGPLEIVVLFIGLLGNSLALTTLVRSSKMRTPSFIYHRALVGANLAFCINFFLNEFANRLLTVEAAGCTTEEQVQYIFRYWIAAFYSGTVYLTINNVCGYVIIYMTLIIALDRVLALRFYKSYHSWNHGEVALSLIAISIVLSAGLNSWSCFVQYSVLVFRMNIDDVPQFVEPCWNESTVYLSIFRANMSEPYKNALKAKNAYNAVIRIVYSILLCVLTIAVLYGLIKRRRRRKRNRSRVANGFLTPYQREESVSVTATSFAVPATPSSPTNQMRIRSLRNRSKNGYEKVLCLLMIAVVVLAFIQVIAGEAKRLLQLFFPPDVLLSEKVANRALSLEERIFNFKLVLYGHQISKLVANFCTAIDRSFVCILYACMNKLFRREMLNLLKRVWRRCSNLDLRHFFWPRRRRVNEIDSGNPIMLQTYPAHTRLHVTISPPCDGDSIERSLSSERPRMMSF